MEILALIIGIAIGAFAAYQVKNKQEASQPRSYVTDEQRFRRAHEVQYVRSWDADAVRNANTVAK